MYKALIIDDERPARQAIIQLGQWDKHGIAVPMETFNCISAFSMMEENPPDIVFVDMYLPVIDGLAFLQKATQHFPNTKFIAVSGFDKFEYARQAFRYGVVEYLLKPIIEEELDQAISKAVGLLNAMQSHAPPMQGIHQNITIMDTVATEILDYILMHYSAEINLTMFSQQYCLTKEYLSRCFKEKTGYGIYEFVTKTRMEKAKALLDTSDIQIRVIAEMVGYQDQNYFSRAFKKFYGVHPSKIRMDKLEKKGREKS